MPNAVYILNEKVQKACKQLGTNQSGWRKDTEFWAAGGLAAAGAIERYRCRTLRPPSGADLTFCFALSARPTLESYVATQLFVGASLPRGSRGRHFACWWDKTRKAATVRPT